MATESVDSDREFFTWCLRLAPVAGRRLATLRPDFLVIAPPKTGTTWLAENLRCHPELFVARTKEVRYFSSWCDWLDLNWYLDHFADGVGRVKGEASPSYAILPVERIRLIRRLMPDVKLIFLLRDPIARAWSHARHNHVYREANFADVPQDFADIGPEQWRANFRHEWTVASGDYLGQLRRWLAVFPRDQMYVGFYESIASAPEHLLGDLFPFLGVRTDVDFSTFRLRERIQPGLPAPLPPDLRADLQELWSNRTRELVPFLREQFNLRLPPEWGMDRSSTGPTAASAPAAVFEHEFDDGFLAGLLAQEEGFRAEPFLVSQGHQGYNIVLHRGHWYGLQQILGPLDLARLPDAERRRLEATGGLVRGPSPTAVKERVEHHIVGDLQRRLRTVESEHAAQIRDLETQLARARERLTGLEHALCEVQRGLLECVNAPYQPGSDGREALATIVVQIMTQAFALYRWQARAVRLVRKAWRWLSRRALTGSVAQPST